SPTARRAKHGVLLASAVHFFLLKPPAPPDIYTLSLHDALPIFRRSRNAAGARHQSGPPGASEPLPLGVAGGHQLRRLDDLGTMRSEEHTSELQSRGHLVCRLLLEKKKIASRSGTPQGRTPAVPR